MVEHKLRVKDIERAADAFVREHAQEEVHAHLIDGRKSAELEHFFAGLRHIDQEFTEIRPLS